MTYLPSVTKSMSPATPGRGFIRVWGKHLFTYINFIIFFLKYKTVRYNHISNFKLMGYKLLKIMVTIR